MDTAAFGRISAITVRIAEDLEDLAGWTFKDAKGEKEYDRQWCMALNKKIDRASYRGDDEIRSLVQQFQVRLRRLKERPPSLPEPPASRDSSPEEPKK